MSGNVWVAVTPTLPSVSDGFGEGWQHLGTVMSDGTTTSGQAVLSKLLQGRGPRLRKLAFYVEADPSNVIAQDLLKPDARFWLGFDAAGDGRRILTTRLQGRLGVSRFRPPEPHPGLINHGTPICLRIDADAEGFFNFPR